MYDLKLMEKSYDNFFHNIYKNFGVNEDIHVLDVGCGDGRDSARFKQMGMNLYLMDIELNKILRTVDILLDFPGMGHIDGVYSMDIRNVGFFETFHAIWANAILHHIPKDNLYLTFHKIYNSLKIDGVFYFSFKEGMGREYDKTGRFFQYMTKDCIFDILSMFPFKLISFWENKDYRNNDRVTNWLNFVVTKEQEMEYDENEKVY